MDIYKYLKFYLRVYNPMPVPIIILGSINPVFRSQLDIEYSSTNLYKRVYSENGLIRTSHIQAVINNHQRPVLDCVKIEQIGKLAERFGTVIIVYLKVDELSEVKHIYKLNSKYLKPCNL